MKTLYGSIGALIVILASTSWASACSCMAPPPPLESLDRASVVFVGEVRSQETAPDGYMQVFTFDVVEAWKGVSEPELTVKTGQNSADCGFPFQVGESYLVYGSGDDELVTNICTRTCTYDSAEKDLAELGAPTYTAGAGWGWSSSTGVVALVLALATFGLIYALRAGRTNARQKLE